MQTLKTTATFPDGPTAITLDFDEDSSALWITSIGHAIGPLPVTYDQKHDAIDLTAQFADVVPQFRTTLDGEPDGAYLGLYVGVDLFAHVALPRQERDPDYTAILDANGVVLFTVPLNVDLYVDSGGARYHCTVAVMVRGLQ